MPPARAALALLLLAAPALAGCVVEPDRVEEGRHLERPVQGTDRHSLDLKAVLATIGEGDSARTESWDVTEGRFEAGVILVATERFAMRYRIDEPLPVALVWDEDLSRENSFTFTYREDAPRAITRVVSVNESSRLRATTYDPVSQDVAGFFEARFVGACDAGSAGCADPDARHEVVLHVRFPKPTH